MAEISTVVPRKQKRSGLAKQVRKWTNKARGYFLPVARYTLVPGLIFYAMYYTEPAPSFLDLVNPLF